MLTVKRFKVYVNGKELPLTVFAKDYESAFELVCGKPLNGPLQFIALTDYNKTAKRVCYKCVRTYGFGIGKIINVSVHEL